MSVTSGSIVSSDNVNQAFCSKVSTTVQTMVAPLDLDHASSGDQVSNVQQEINYIKERQRWKPYTVESISASGTIASSTDEWFQVRRVKGSGAAVTAASAIFGTSSGWEDGMMIRLVGQDSTNTVTILYSDIQFGIICNGDIVLEKYSTVDFQYCSVNQRWIETSRNF